ncbi:MAG TPA: SDR family NAD(P)-dependent oxidoreductase [Kofleriaceae bacterium]|nr:SDR family NAD(P)-dependent oxidoreductase [Kofleriaceae bacterium]
MTRLQGKIAVVTGASRGGGRGVAVELGAAGATVYVTGRTSRSHAPPAYERMLAQGHLEKMPGTIEDVAEEVTAAGGRGIAVRCDHSDVAQVRELFARVDREQGQLDLLVNNAWGGHETLTADQLSAPFWELSIDHWESMFDHGVRNHVVASHAAAPLFVRQRRGLIITTSFWDRGRYIKGNLFYDVAKATMNRFAFALAEELRAHEVTSVALVPGWMRTEIILAAFSTDERGWTDVPPLARTESPRYLGRAVVALASDPHAHQKTGEVLYVGELAARYGFTDVDGRVIPPFEM